MCLRLLATTATTMGIFSSTAATSTSTTVTTTTVTTTNEPAPGMKKGRGEQARRVEKSWPSDNDGKVGVNQPERVPCVGVSARSHPRVGIGGQPRSGGPSMIKNAKQFVCELASFADQTTTIKTNADLLRSVLKKKKQDKDSSVGGVLISSHAKWLAEQQPEFAKRLKDLQNMLKEADKLIAEMKKDIPESLKDCEAYFIGMTELKELLEKY